MPAVTCGGCGDSDEAVFLGRFPHTGPGYASLWPPGRFPRFSDRLDTQRIHSLLTRSLLTLSPPPGSICPSK